MTTLTPQYNIYFLLNKHKSKEKEKEKLTNLLVKSSSFYYITVSYSFPRYYVNQKQEKEKSIVT